MKIKRYFYLAFQMMKINVRSGFQYPAYLIGWLLSNPLQFIFGLVIINVVISKFQPLGGWSFEQIVFLYGLGIISHGLSIVFFIQTWGMGHRITEGGFDRMLVRPLNVFFQFCFECFNFIGLTDLIPGAIIFGYGCVAVGFQFTLLNTLKILIALIGTTLLRGGIFTIVGSLSFWIKRTHPLIDINLTLFDYNMRYPLSIYPELIQGLFTFLLPYGFLAFYPASELLNIDVGFSLPISLCWWTLLVGMIVYLIGVSLFKIGLKKYESSGS